MVLGDSLGWNELKNSCSSIVRRSLSFVSPHRGKRYDVNKNSYCPCVEFFRCFQIRFGQDSLVHMAELGKSLSQKKLLNHNPPEPHIAAQPQ